MPDEVVTTPFGKFLIPKGDLIGETLRAGTLWDGPGFLQPLAVEHGCLGERGVTILDVGANLGQFSVWLARQGAWRVIAVEPVPETMRYLKANLDLNREVCAWRVLTLEVAAYDREARLICPEPLDRGNLGGTSLRPSTTHAHGSIAGVPLDDSKWLFGQRVSLIKIDAQGCDGAALHGLEKTLKRDHPAIIFEWDAALSRSHGYTLPETLTWLAFLGYATHEWPSHPNNFLATWRS